MSIGLMVCKKCGADYPEFQKHRCGPDWPPCRRACGSIPACGHVLSCFGAPNGPAGGAPAQGYGAPSQAHNFLPGQRQ